jgi:hypothetical protein
LYPFLKKKTFCLKVLDFTMNSISQLDDQILVDLGKTLIFLPSLEILIISLNTLKVISVWKF